MPKGTEDLLQVYGLRFESDVRIGLHAERH